MPSYSVQKQTVQGRLGRLDKWGDKKVELATPQCLVCANSGHVPHLTWEVVEKTLTFSQTPVYQVALGTVFESLDIIEEFGKGFSKFAGMPDNCPVHLSMYDPFLHLTPGYNEAKNVSIWTKTGRRKITVDILHKIDQVFSPESIQLMSDVGFESNCTNKRLTKSIVRSNCFVQQMSCQMSHIQNKSLFLSLTGGYSAFHRSQNAKNIAELDFPAVAGYVFDGFHQFADDLTDMDVNNDVGPVILGNILPHLPVGKVRLFNGCFNPVQILSLVTLGLDLFDSSYPLILADKAQAFLLDPDFPAKKHFELVNFVDEKFAADFVPLFGTCHCFVCPKYTRAYLRHLKNTDEMLLQVLLVIHNLQEYDRMFQIIREHLRKL